MMDSQRGPWTVAEHPGNCRMCGARWNPGARGLVCACCGQEEPDEVPGILDQLG